MSQIKILSDRVANQIAAGEVIERPVAVVKELIENSIDADARKITIAIKNGGKSLIKVTDDGIGMEPDDALIALERHATSKLIQASDLNSIRTFGFRGEALPSIASVSNFVLKTKRENALEACEIFISAGKLIHNKACGMPHGTSIEVSHLFKGVPARRKFLKSEATETAHIYYTVRLFALAHPTISFELVDNGRSVIKSPSCSDLSDRISEIWNQNISKDLFNLDASSDCGRLHLKGLISKIGTTRSTRREMIFFVNNRPVDNKTLTYAVMDAYSGRIPKGKFPICFLFIEIDPSEIDVNVHPTKREIKFRNETTVRHCILQAVHSKLEAANQVIKSENSIHIKSFPEASPLPVFKSTKNAQSPVEEAPASYQSDPSKAKPIPRIKAEIQGANKRTQDPHSEKNFNNQSNWKFIQVLKNKFALYQTPNGLVLLNTLRANQRIYFESILEDLREHSHSVQELLIPLQIELEPLAANALEEYSELLNSKGFQLESLGKQFYRLLSIPAWLEINQAEAFINDLINQLRTRGAFSKNPKQSLFWEMLAKLAIKEFYFYQPETTSDILKAIPTQLFQCKEPLINPLGKAIYWEIDWTEIQKKID